MKPYFETKLGKLYHGDCLDIMPDLKPVDLVVTSPPYDNLREYNGFTFDFEGIAKQLYRITSYGGVVVWIVGDATINGSETGTSFKQALYFKEVGFNLHDTMIWKKTNPIPLNHNRYEQQFEYMFVFSKNKPKTFNPIKIKTLGFGKEYSWDCKNDYGDKSAKRSRDERSKTSKYKIEYNIWEFPAAYSKITNSAPFPRPLVNNHILSWSNKNEIILDPFIGSGTSAMVCEELNRRWIGIEISEKYCEISARRIESANKEQRLPGF